MAKRIGIALAAAIAASMIVGGVWSALGKTGSPGPIFGVVFGVVFALGYGLQKPKDGGADPKP
ncbi:MAG: hypothetical protein U0359_13645 [Byssovorax sp.]